MICYLIFCVIKDKTQKISSIEGFSQKQEIMVYNNNNLYDKFYANVYSVIFDNQEKNLYELDKIVSITKMNKKSNVLDIGSGTGFHVNVLTREGIPTTGVDLSKAMVNKANELYPKSSFKQGDILKLLDMDLISPSEKFTHIMLLYFTIYYIKNKQLLFENCFNLLDKGGYLAIHLVDKNRFDTLLDVSNPLVGVDVQKYAKKRITNSVVKFKNFDYNANFTLDKNDICRFTETFKKKDGKTRINKHTLFMNTQKEILSMAKMIGFTIKAQINLSGVNHKNQYIYILHKS